MANYTSRHTGTEIDDAIDKVSELEQTLVNKLEKNMGVANAGKTLIVGADGNISIGELEENKMPFLEYATKTEEKAVSNKGVITDFNGSTKWDYYEGEIVPKGRVHIKGFSSYAYSSVIFYNSSGQIIYFYPETSTGGGEIEFTIEIPETAHRMVVNIRRDVADRGIFSVDWLPDLADVATLSYLTGKKLVACGDSITDAYDLSKNDGSYIKSYAELVSERCGMEYTKNAVSGSTMAYNVGGDSNISTQAFSYTRYQNLPEFDYLTIFFGWNDKSNSTLGTIDDTDNTTFYGAYKKVLEYLITNNPTKKIGIVVPYGRTANGMGDFDEAVRQVSKMYGVPCLDLQNFNQCSLIFGEDNPAQIARKNALTFDGTHPNQVGHEFLSTMYEEFLKRL